MKDKFSNLLKDTFIFALGNLGSKLILFFMVPLYTNYMTTEEYGIADFVFSVSQLVIPVLSISIWEAVLRYGLKKEEKKEDVIKCGALIFLACSVILIVITPVWNLYAPVSNWKWYLTAYSICFISNQIELFYIRVKEKNKLFAIASISQTFTLASLNIFLLVIVRCGIKGYLLANILSLGANTVFLLILGGIFKDIKQGRIRSDLMKQMIIYASPLVVNNISWWAIHSSDKIMIEAMLTAGELGLYTVATKIPSLINVFISIFSQAWSVSSIKEVENSNDSKYYSDVFDFYSMLAFGATAGLCLVIKVFMKFYVGNDFYVAWKYVPLLLVAASFSAISTYFASLLSALEKSVHTMTSTFVGGVANVLINYVFIQIYGVWGAIIGTVAAYVIISMMRMKFVLQRINIAINWAKFGGNAAIVMVQAILVSMDYCVYIVSIISLIIFLVNNRKNMCSIVHVMLKKVHK